MECAGALARVLVAAAGRVLRGISLELEELRGIFLELREILLELRGIWPELRGILLELGEVREFWLSVVLLVVVVAETWAVLAAFYRHHPVVLEEVS